jgi:hypothetical protein
MSTTDPNLSDDTTLHGQVELKITSQYFVDNHLDR